MTMSKIPPIICGDISPSSGVLKLFRLNVGGGAGFGIAKLEGVEGAVGRSGDGVGLGGAGGVAPGMSTV